MLVKCETAELLGRSKARRNLMVGKGLPSRAENAHAE